MEEENICDDVIYADPGRRSRCRPKGAGLSPGYAHRVGVPIRGVTTWGCNLRGVNLQGLSLAFTRGNPKIETRWTLDGGMPDPLQTRPSSTWVTSTLPNVVAVGQTV